MIGRDQVASDFVLGFEGVFLFWVLGFEGVGL